MAVTGSVEDAGLRQKLSNLIEELNLAGGTDAVIRPTVVLYELCRMKGQKLLSIIPQAKADAVKREMIPYVENAIQGHAEGWEGRVARAYRRWAYRFIEELYVAVRDARSWGQVTAETKRRKEADKTLGKGVPPESFGVRHVRPDWRRIQKGQSLAGKREPDKQEEGPTITVIVNGREVSR